MFGKIKRKKFYYIWYDSSDYDSSRNRIILQEVGIKKFQFGIRDHEIESFLGHKMKEFMQWTQLKILLLLAQLKEKY